MQLLVFSLYSACESSPSQDGYLIDAHHTGMGQVHTSSSETVAVSPPYHTKSGTEVKHNIVVTLSLTMHISTSTMHNISASIHTLYSWAMPSLLWQCEVHKLRNISVCHTAGGQQSAVGIGEFSSHINQTTNYTWGSHIVYLTFSPVNMSELFSWWAITGNWWCPFQEVLTENLEPSSAITLLHGYEQLARHHLSKEKPSRDSWV